MSSNDRASAIAYLLIPIRVKTLQYIRVSVPPKRGWEEAEVTLLARLGDQLGVALQQAEYLQQLQAQSKEIQQSAERTQFVSKIVVRIR
ncbi:MAG: hypothetical protein ACHBN1_25075 [Heteroscytonema crispum UTEX LB 1556]